MRTASSRPPFSLIANERVSEGNANPRGWTAHDRSMPGDRPRKRPAPRTPPRRATDAELTTLVAGLESEAGFQAWVIERAGHFGFEAWHDHDSRRNRRGLPDLILVRPAKAGRPGRLIFAELKRQRGRLSVEQQVWVAMLATCPCEVYVWRPSDRTEIERVLGLAEAPVRAEAADEGEVQ